MSQNERWKPQSPFVTAPELSTLAARHPVLVIHCGAVWNGYDVGVDARLQRLRGEFSPRIGIYAIDYDDETNWPFLKETVVNIPAVVGFVNGARQPTITGAHGEEYLRDQFQKWFTLANAAPETFSE